MSGWREDPAFKQHMRDIAKRGGQSRSDAKRAAVRDNQRKAVEALRIKRLRGGQ